MAAPAGGDAPGHDPARRVRRLAGREVLVDDEGFLWDPAQWTEGLALALAREAGLAELGEIHWRVLRCLREHYGRFGRAPLNREVKAATGLSLAELEGLFPGGLRGGARRLAGLPNPKSCM